MLNHDEIMFHKFCTAQKIYNIALFKKGRKKNPSKEESLIYFGVNTKFCGYKL